MKDVIANHLGGIAMTPRVPQSTMYAIKLSAPINLWASKPNDLGVTRWLDDPTHAIQAGSMLEATIYAIEFLSLNPDAFTIEAVEGR